MAKRIALDGNPHIRFDKWEVASETMPRCGSLLYKDFKRFLAIVLATCVLSFVKADATTSSLCFTDNDGRYTITGINGERFVTGWSECSADSVYAYKDYVKLVGISDTLTDFPKTSASFVNLDWEQCEPKIQEGEFVVFMNDQAQFLCVKVVNVKVKSRGDSEDKLTIEYRVYGTDADSAQIINVAHEARLRDYEVVGGAEGTANFCFVNNSGCFTVIGPNNERFVTDWSERSADSVYACKDYVNLVGVSDTLTDFPETSASFVNLDWEQRAPKIQEGEFVVFMNDQAQFLCVKVIDVKVKSRGDSENLLVFQYKIYGTNPEVASAILTKHENRMNEYAEVGKDEGMVSFCFANNGGRFTIVGMDGTRFVTAWSECGSDTIYAYKDYVKVVGVSDTLNGFPETSAAFIDLAWEQRARTIKVGSFVVFMNDDGRFLCAHVKKIGTKSRGAVDNIVVFDYKIYEYDQSVSAAVLDLANRINWGFAIVKVDVSANGIVKIPYDGDDWKSKVRLIKRVRAGGIEREVDLTNLLTVPFADKGQLDLSKAEVNSEIVAEVLDSNKGAIVDFSSRIPKIKTANTRDGLTYEFYDAESLDALKTALPKEVIIGDGHPFTPNISSKTGTCRFFRVKVSK